MNDDAYSLEMRLGRVLGVGSLVSMVLFAAGLAALFLGAGATLSDALVRAGLVILIGTPFARVVVMTLAYARRGEWRFVAMTGIVLLVLLAGVFVAMR